MRNGKICHLWAKNRALVSVPMDRDKVVSVPKVSGTGTHLQKRVGTGTDASGSPDCCTLALLNPNSYTDSI